MPHYIALIHKDRDSCYGVSFSDVPGVFTAGDTIDEAVAKAAEVLSFAAEDWTHLAGQPFPSPRTIDTLRTDPDFREQAVDAVLVAVPFHATAAAAE
jgi:antitoxin HicB